MNYDRIREALPVESGNGRRSTIRARSDVVEVVIDCVLRRRQFPTAFENEECRP